MSDFKYIVPPNEPRIVKDVGDVGIAPSVPLNISNSCLFNGSSSSLNRSLSVAGNRRTWTWSGWVKRNRLSVTTSLFFAGQNGPGDTYILFESNDAIATGVFGSGTWTWLHQSSALFRDVSAWYHVVVSWDTTNVVDSERIKLYVNGNRIDRFSTQTFPALNSTGEINNTTYINYIGRDNVPRYSDIYLAEVNFIDGQVLTPSSFGTLSNRTNSWIPIRYTGSYTGNSFYLNFSNSSNLGLDSSGRNNNFTLSGITSSNQTTDTPSNNFCTLNTLLKDQRKIAQATFSASLSNGNLDWTNTAGSVSGGCSATISASVKCYFEARLNTVGFEATIGVSKAEADWRTVGGASDSTLYCWDAYGGSYYNGGSSLTGKPTATTGDILMVAYDPSNGKIWFGKNGTWNGSGNPSSGTNEAFVVSDYINPKIPFILGYNSASLSLNFGQRAFTYTPPAGFKSLCSANLSIPTIRKPNQFFDASIYTGNGGTQNIPLSFNPDFIWLKSRSVARSHRLQDSVRGFDRVLVSDTTAAEYAGLNIDSTSSSGFTLNASDNQNNAGETYVGWSWCGGSSTVSNTAGSITSTVRANPIAGFSIVSYTGTGANATVGHGLGSVPKMIITRTRNATSSRNWCVYHANLTSAAYSIFLDTNDVQAIYANVWNSTTPNNSVFSVGSNASSNELGKDMIAYLWSEIEGYSKFGSYIGNGSTDGPFVYCGFRPRWIMIKHITTAGGNAWSIWDTARATGNQINRPLYANLTNTDSVDSSWDYLDILSNGFKVRGTNAGTINYGVGTPVNIFAAFAETPFKYANAR